MYKILHIPTGQYVVQKITFNGEVYAIDSKLAKYQKPFYSFSMIFYNMDRIRVHVGMDLRQGELDISEFEVIEDV